MQGQHPTGYAQTPAQRATSDTTRNANRDWTCQRWFNNIADKVSTKTHQYFGKFVAVASAPFTFIPSLACDLFYGAKSLLQRTVSTAPVLNHFSTGSISSSTSESNTSPTIDQLRQKFSVLDEYITRQDAADSKTEKQLSSLNNLCQKLIDDQVIVAKANNDKTELLNRKIKELLHHIQCLAAINLGQKHKIIDLQQRIYELEIENNQPKSCLRQFQDTKPSPGLDHTKEERLKTSAESITSTSVDSQPEPIIVVEEEEDDSTTKKGTETDYIHSVSTKEPAADNSGAVHVATGGTKCSVTSETSSSDESFETIPLPLSNAPKDAPTPKLPELVKPLNSESPFRQNSPQVD